MDSKEFKKAVAEFERIKELFRVTRIHKTSLNGLKTLLPRELL
jgi:hypothetical protein